jgi:small-conductance mechanosensitive channel
MRFSQKLTLIALLLFIGAGIAGLILNGRSPSIKTQSKTTQNGDASGISLNQEYLDTAKRLVPLATTAQEQKVAQDALRNADQELDLEFAAALQSAGKQPIVQSPEVRDIQQRIGKIQASIEAEQAEVNQLTEAVKKAKGDQQAATEQQLDVSQAELNFYKERLEDSKDDLIHAGGDPHSRVQQLVDEHKAASESADSVKFPPAREQAAEPSSLLAKWWEWKTVRRKQKQLWQAQQEAIKAAEALTGQYGPLQEQISAEQQQRKAIIGRANGEEATVPGPGTSRIAPGSKQAAAAAIALLQHTLQDQKSLAIMGRRIRSLHHLGLTYDQWIRLVGADARTVLSDIIASAIWIAVLMLAVFLINRMMERFFDHLTLEHKQRVTLRAVFRIAVQVVAVIVILIMIFGPPNQLSTVLGLAGAGLTVVLKDFIVSFLGWFVLMGRHGIHVGDWVEIDGVRGEVIEISLLRTVLLETGNWTDAGQPTGRQVAFLNQYAVDGYYFNFTTSGQWLWDELQVLIPAGQDPYPLIEKIRAIAEKETESSSRLAESEWQRVSRRYGVRSFSAQPTVNVKPTDTGVIVIVRYITRAQERSDVRFRLYHEVVKLLRGGAEIAAAPAPPPPSTNATEPAHRTW